MVTSCAHNCGSRHVLVAHKKGDVIVRLSTDNGSYQEGGSYGKDTELEPQLRACLRGRSYRSRIYSPERLLYPMIRVGERGEGKFRRASWDEALNLVASKMVQTRDQRPQPRQLAFRQRREQLKWEIGWRRKHAVDLITVNAPLHREAPPLSEKLPGEDITY